MFSMFRKKDNTMVGIDIGTSAVKLVAFSRQDGQLTLEGYAVVPLPPTAVIDGNIQDVAKVSELIAQAAGQAGGKLHRAAVAVPSSAVITKFIELSAAFTELELEEQIKLEADHFIPYPLEDVALDFEVLEPLAHNADINRLMLVACRRGDVEQREEAVAGAGLTCDIVDVDSFAVERAFQLLPPGDGPLTGMVDIGAATLTLYVFKEGRIIYNREQAFGGNELVNAVNQHTGLALEEIELSLRSGQLSDEIRQLFVLPFRTTVAQQVSRALQFFYSSGMHSSLQKLYLMGGTATIPGLAEQLAEALALPTETANPFTGLAISPKLVPGRLQQDAPTLVKASGLAMRTPMSRH